jgi:hypothetical protein
VNWRCLWSIRPVHRFQCNPAITYRRAIVMVVATFFIIAFPLLHYLLQLPLTGRVSERKLPYTAKTGGRSSIVLYWQKGRKFIPKSFAAPFEMTECLFTQSTVVSGNRISILGEAKEFILGSKRPRPTLEVTQLPVHQYSGMFSLLYRGGGLYSLSLILIQGWSITTPPHVFMTCSDVTLLRNRQSYI